MIAWTDDTPPLPRTKDEIRYDVFRVTPLGDILQSKNTTYEHACRDISERKSADERAHRVRRVYAIEKRVTTTVERREIK
jgi:hypothetical protein